MRRENPKVKKVKILICYVDGACQGNGTNHSKGGYGVVILDDNENLINYYQHFEDNTTNNRQEMKAILYCLINFGNKGFALNVYSDSAYAINTFTSWMYGWERNGWLKANGLPPENLDLIKAYYNLIQQGYKINLMKVAGHSGNQWNELADDLATGRKKI